MTLAGKKVFVAGATGMAGHAIVQELLSATPSVSLRGSFRSNAPFFADERIEYVPADLTIPADCRRLIEGCDAGVMVAAVTAGAAGSTLRPWDQVDSNLHMNITLLGEAARAGVSRMVVVGSASLYQDFAGSIREEQLDLNLDPPPAMFGIGWVARCVEKLCAFWHVNTRLEFRLVRAANIFGPWARFDPSTSNFIPALIRKAVDRMDPFEVWGSPAVTRDVIYVKDFARAVVLLLQLDGTALDVFNIGSGTPSTVADVVEWCLECSRHSPSQVTYSSGAPTTVSHRALDCSKAQNLLGWKPVFSVKAGIEETVEWWREHRNAWTR